MILQSKKFFFICYLLIPFFLITGPAIPDLIISIGGIFGLAWLVFKDKELKIYNYNYVKVSIFFWISLILISFFAEHKGSSFQDSIIFIRYLIIPICIYFLFFRENRNFNYLLLVILILVILVSIDTIYQFFNYTSEDGFGEDLLGFKSNWYGRLTGPFGNELIPGSYVSKFGIIGFVYLLINKFFRNKLFLKSIYLSLVIVVCFISGERMAFSIFLLALLILLFILENNRLTIFIAIILGLTSIFFIYKLHPFYNDYKIIESTEHHQGLKIEKNFICEYDNKKNCSKIISLQPSFIEIIKNFRTSAYGEIYLLSFEMFKNHPLTGIGMNNFKFLCEKQKKYKEMMVNYNCASHPHNIYIQWLTEGGILVFIFFIIYQIFLFRFIINNDGDKSFKIISIVLIIILFWPIMSTGSLLKNWYGICIFFIIGVSLCISRIKKNV